MKRFLKCPQCGISNFYVKDGRGNKLLVKVNDNGQLVPKNEHDSLEGFHLDEIFCLGCSWHGAKNKLKKY